MRRGISLYGTVVCAVTLLIPALIPAAARADATVTQEFELRPGWNAIFLEVQPEPDDPATVFAGVPVESVWTWFEPSSAVQFIQNPGEGDWNQAAWGAYLKAEDQGFLTNLHAVIANRAYLVKLEGSQAVSWSVAGRPTSGLIEWVADSFNLVGFRVASAPPTFADLLAPSSAHVGQAIYRIGDSGNWEFVDDPASASVRSGEAYWVYCEGASTYQGTLDVQLPGGDGLDFGALTDSLTITLHNLSDQTVDVTIVPLSTDVDLAYRTLSETGDFEWPPLQDMPAIRLGPDGWNNLRIAVRRETLEVERAESVIQITDGRGTRLQVPVLVEKEATP